MVCFFAASVHSLFPKSFLWVNLEDQTHICAVCFRIGTVMSLGFCFDLNLFSPPVPVAPPSYSLVLLHGNNKAWVVTCLPIYLDFRGRCFQSKLSGEVASLKLHLEQYPQVAQLDQQLHSLRAQLADARIRLSNTTATLLDSNRLAELEQAFRSLQAASLKGWCFTCWRGWSALCVALVVFLIWEVIWNDQCLFRSHFLYIYT